MPLPSVGGTLQKDIDPATLALADGTTLTVGNSGLSQVGSQPQVILKHDIFGSGKHAILAQGSIGAGFAITNPVTDDFTIYGVWRFPTGYGGTGPDMTANGPLFASSGNNVYGASLRQDGKVTAGTTSMGGGLGGDQTVLSTTVVGMDTHRVAIRRVKSTGLFKLYVDGSLQGSFSYNTNSLNSGGSLFFFIGGTSNRAGGFLGRWLAYDAAHSDADLATMDAYLLTEYPQQALEMATKVSGYAALGLPQGRAVASKVVAYAVLQYVEILPSQVY